MQIPVIDIGDVIDVDLILTICPTHGASAANCSSFGGGAWVAKPAFERAKASRLASYLKQLAVDPALGQSVR